MADHDYKNIPYRFTPKVWRRMVPHIKSVVIGWPTPVEFTPKDMSLDGFAMYLRSAMQAEVKYGYSTAEYSHEKLLTIQPELTIKLFDNKVCVLRKGESVSTDIIQADANKVDTSIWRLTEPTKAILTSLCEILSARMAPDYSHAVIQYNKQETYNDHMIRLEELESRLDISYEGNSTSHTITIF